MTKLLREIIRHWPSQEAEQWTLPFIQRACSDSRILGVVAFGSAVRADHCADIDLLVIYEGLKPKVHGRPVDVDIRWHERSEVERLLGKGHELLGWVVRFGELICERGGYWTKLRESW